MIPEIVAVHTEMAYFARDDDIFAVLAEFRERNSTKRNVIKVAQNGFFTHYAVFARINAQNKALLLNVEICIAAVSAHFFSGKLCREQASPI